MAGTAQRKRRKEAKQEKLRFANSVGSDLPLPAPPSFGPPKFTPEQQAAHPDEPMTRVVKDICREGVWKAGFGPNGQAVSENFSGDVLRQILGNAKAYMRRYDINLGKGHGDEELAIHPDDLITPLDDVIFSNGVLWGSFYCTPEQAKYLKNPAIKTSPGLVRNYRAGDMTVYPGLSMVHVAATDRPTIGGQGRFLALTNWICPKARRTAPQQHLGLSNTIKKFRARFQGRNVMQRAIALANSLSQGAGKMDLKALIAAINAIFLAMGLGQLGEDTNETNIIGRLEGLGMALGAAPPEEPAADPANPDPGGGGAGTDPNADPTGAGIAMRNSLIGRANQLIDRRMSAFEAKMKPIIDGVQTLLSSETNKAKEAKKATYMTFRNRLGEAGVVEAVLAKKDAIAEKMDWDPEVLEGLVPTITMSNATKAGAKEDPPEGSGGQDGEALSNEAMKKRLEARGIDPKLMPTG